MLFLLDDETTVTRELAKIGLEAIQARLNSNVNMPSLEAYISEFNVYVTRDGKVFKRLGPYKYEFTYYVCKQGYSRVHVTLPNKKRRTAAVHRLVAQAFIENNENKSDVNHIDGDRGNNSVENLEWVTKSENILHGFRVLGAKGRRHTKKEFLQ